MLDNSRQCKRIQYSTDSTDNSEDTYNTGNTDNMDHLDITEFNKTSYKRNPRLFEFQYLFNQIVLKQIHIF